MSDSIEQIRQAAANPSAALLACAHAYITTLLAEVDRLHEALRPFAVLAEDVDNWRHDDEDTCLHRLRAADVRRARSVLGGEQ